MNDKKKRYEIIVSTIVEAANGATVLTHGL